MCISLCSKYRSTHYKALNIPEKFSKTQSSGERETDRGINQRSRPVDSKLKTVPSLLKVSVQMFWGMGCIFVVAVCLHTDFERKCAAEDVNHCQKPKVLNTSPYFSPYLKTHMAILG